ncbi:hypothetical protein M758_10G148400 [Ceratodon purpureus]|nr:hypothetical protein KC19_10G153700 [Ceratodon purpureus]KAG0560092.1 hypothetical protein KC19_10G153700 [Ceratodon purpureus]KAG0604142.1 hypothetical protein M758_10G148400 [Ceratodon purpureus]KAG0604144.1 hypothetical protein M758_10G148400 [Ceratodon purpureus]
MTASIWSKTPDHLLERILAFLPVEDLLRMRSVCKKWSCDILNVPMFRELHRELSPRQQPWFLVSTIKRSFSAYDVNTHKWNVLSVSKLPDPDLKVLASSQGLLCYGLSSGEDFTTTDVYVCNPITGEWKHLPQHPEKTVDHFGMKYDDKTNSYKILTMNVGSTGSMIRRVTIYDSKSNQWTEGPIPRSTMHFSKAPMVWCGDRVYFMDRIRPFCELYAFNIEQFTWHELQASAPQFFEFPSLVACKDRLFMVGLRSDGRKIWEVVERPAGLEFTEYDTLPAQLPNEFAVKKKPSVGAGRCANYNPFRLSAVGSSNNLMCFSSNLDHTWVLLYDTNSKTFHESPKDTHAVQVCEHADLPFQPCLDASP